MLRLPLAAPALVVASLLSIAPATAAPETAVRITGLVVAKAEISGGRLNIQGYSPWRRIPVSIVGTSYSAVTDVFGGFSFSLAYLPPDCMVRLSAQGTYVDAVVAMCGPRGIDPRGEWSASVTYGTDDIVTFDGSSWIALRTSTGAEPDLSPADWRVFAARGAAGPAGARGATGPAGPQGPQGPTGSAGPQGAVGPTGPDGAKGDAGPAGPRGITPKGPWSAAETYAIDDVVTHQGSAWRAATANSAKTPGVDPDWQVFAAGATGTQGPQGAAGPQGLQGPQGIPGPTGPQGSTGSTGPQGPQGATGAQGPKGDTGQTGATGAAGPRGPGATGQYVFSDVVDTSQTVTGAWSSSICEVTLVTTGGIVLLDGNLDVFLPDGGVINGTLYRDEQNIKPNPNESTVGHMALTGTGYSTVFPFTLVDQPASGTHTYSVRVWSYARALPQHCNLSAIEFALP